MSHFPQDIDTELSADVDTLRNLGPLCASADIWAGQRDLDIKPKKDGPGKTVPGPMRKTR